MSISNRAAIVGLCESPRRHAPEVHPYQIQMECVQGALVDAGLSLADVDGLCVAAGDWAEGGGVNSVTEFAEYAGLRPTWFNSTDVGGAAPTSCTRATPPRPSRRAWPRSS